MALDDEDCAEILGAISADVLGSGDPTLIAAFESVIGRHDELATSRLSSFLNYFAAHAERESAEYIDSAIRTINNVPHEGTEIAQSRLVLNGNSRLFSEEPIESVDLRDLAIYGEGSALNEVRFAAKSVLGQIEGFRGPDMSPRL